MIDKVLCLACSQEFEVDKTVDGPSLTFSQELAELRADPRIKNVEVVDIRPSNLGLGRQEK